jgi:Protein of unknown function (DUF4058)
MPSPFPGMDPYLEGPHWMGFHTQLCAEIARQLTPRLVPKYVALINERFVLETVEDIGITTQSIYPDVGMVPRTTTPSDRASTGAAVAPLRLATVMPESVPHVSVEIRDTAQRQLVAAIEVLSPTNKRGEGREEYLARRRHILLSTAHLIEIDLLRAGSRVPMRQPLPSLPYFVFVGRFEQRPLVDVYPIPLDEPLPTIQIPLLAGDAECPLDLQHAFTTVYDALRYDLVVDYDRPPNIAVPPESAAWVQECLRAWRAAQNAS